MRPNNVYVRVPDATLAVAEGVLRVRAAPAASHDRNPIDVFLGSLAEDHGERAVAVILSGVGSDGAPGLAAVKERGGLTIP